MSLDWHGLKPFATITLPDRWPWEKDMGRKELIEKMCEVAYDAMAKGKHWYHAPESTRETWRESIAASLDVAVEELLSAPTQTEATDFQAACGNWAAASLFASRRSRYLPKSDPAVEAVGQVLAKWPYKDMEGTLALEIVAAVRKADAK